VFGEAESGDPSVAPSAARERRAFAAGLRPRARWLVAAGLAGSVLGALHGIEAAAVSRWLGLGALAPHPPAAVDPGAMLAGALQRLVAGTLGIAAVVLAVVTIVTLLSGGLGFVSSTERRRLGLAATGSQPLAAVVGAIALGIGAVALLRGVVAGAARAPAASEAGLAALWSGAASRVLVVMAAVLAVAGALELIASRRANRRALYQTEAQARAEARSGGGGRG
jgi:hypothetical protein